MNNYICSLLFLSFMGTLHAQQPIVVDKVTASSSLALQTIDLNALEFNNDFAFTIGVQKKRPYLFSIYDENSGLNNVYTQMPVDSQIPIRVSRSINLLENEFRSHKIDSFNPYGASSVQEGLLVGAINLLFRGNK